MLIGPRIGQFLPSQQMKTLITNVESISKKLVAIKTLLNKVKVSANVILKQQPHM